MYSRRRAMTREEKSGGIALHKHEFVVHNSSPHLFGLGPDRAPVQEAARTLTD